MTRVLIVEDERIIAWNIQEVLKLTGHDVVSLASTAEEAIAIAEQQHPDLILMDIRLSGALDGIAAAEEIYSNFGIPSIYLTAHADDSTVERAMESAPFGYVLKPFKRNDLLLAIKVAIHRHQHEKKSLRQYPSSDLSHPNPSHTASAYAGQNHGAIASNHAPISSSTPDRAPETTRYSAHSSSAPRYPSGDTSSSLYAALLTKFTKAIRESLDDKAIIQSIIHDVGHGLSLVACHVGIYAADSPENTVVVAAFCQENPDLTHFTPDGEIKSAIVRQFAHKQPIELCLAVPSPVKQRGNDKVLWVSAVTCPIFNHHGDVIGDILAMRDVNHPFNTPEVGLLKHIADQCAIAIRQSHLYQTIQTYQQDMGDRKPPDLIPDSWISALSHELRTPIANIKMASQMLELTLKPSGILNADTNPAYEYFQILRYECQREARLVNVLTEVSQDSATQALTYNPTNLAHLMQEVVEPYHWQLKKKNQRLALTHFDNTLVINTVPSILKDILGELLDYACRYSPSDQEIRILAQRIVDRGSTDEPITDRTLAREPDQRGGVTIQIQHLNMYVSAAQLSQALTFPKPTIRGTLMPQNGTGLGLFLAKQQVDKLSGHLTIQDEDGQDEDQWITFCLSLPN